MTSAWFLVVLEIAVVACGLVSGIFLTFSDFVMKSLAAANPAGGIESMQIINRKVYKSVFMVLLLGMSALSPFLIGYSLLYVSGSAFAWIVAGGASYLAGVFLVTVFCNVPMNKRLDAMDYSSSDAASYWKTYVTNWSFWNHIRSISSGASSVCFLVACNIWLSQVTTTAG